MAKMRDNQNIVEYYAHTLQKFCEWLRTSSRNRQTELVGANAKNHLMIFESFVRRLTG